MSSEIEKPQDVPASTPRFGPGKGSFFQRGGSTVSNTSEQSVTSRRPSLQLVKRLGRSMSNMSQNSITTPKSGKPSSKGESSSSDRTQNNLWALMFDSAVPQEGDSVSPVTVYGGERRLLLEENRLIFPASINLAGGGRPNMVKTTRYTLTTWLPLSLYEQFKRVANVYFLFITCLVCFLAIHPHYESPKDWRSKVGPFVMVLFWTACKDLIEDMARDRDDKLVNTSLCKCFNLRTNDWETKLWQEVLVGDVLFIPKDEPFPADLILLHASGGQDAFISTMTLDGETALKERRAAGIFEVLADKIRSQSMEEWDAAQEAPSLLHDETLPPKVGSTLAQFLEHMFKPGLACTFSCPSPELSDVRGSVQPMTAYLEAQGQGACPVSEVNFLPRGCVLRNTHWCMGLVMYAGADTKTRLNSSPPLPKFSNMQKNLNKCVRGLLCLLFSICFTAAILKQAGQGTFAGEATEQIHIIFMMYCVKFYHVVPISLYLMYELLKLLLIFQVNHDCSMVDPVTGDPALCRTADLVEEMGQIDFIFSDKTGTLTKNEMVFARCHVSGRDLGDFRKQVEGADLQTDGSSTLRKMKSRWSGRRPTMESPASSRNVPRSTEAPPGVVEARRLMALHNEPLAQAVKDLFTCLALCHTVQVTQSGGDQTQYTYTGMSPDEVALVQAAQEVGVVFEQRVRLTSGSHANEVVIHDSKGRTQWKMLQELAFSSDRKRMSVIVRQAGVTWCITKGADNVMGGLLDEPYSEAALKDLAAFGRQGLRMLVVATRKLDKKEYDSWSRAVSDARNLVDATRNEKVAELYASLEKGLTFVGVTAVEDRLQDEVPETIKTLKAMGIRTWVLTGDKTETAVEIARSCQLFRESTTLVYATKATSVRKAEDLLLAAYPELTGKEDTGLVLDGQTLQYALESRESRKLAVDVGLASRACVCTRMSPMQKSQLVQLVQDHNSKTITLAIGDGANDVPMIQSAHLGIAVRGKEGTQAVQASDVAISQFRFLVPLLATHGRRAYRRVATFLSFYLYKNVALLMADVLWLVQDKFGPDIAYPEYLSIGFNVFYSTWHVLLVLGFDKDLPDHVSNRSPELYEVGPKRKLFNAHTFSCWVVLGCYHGCVMWLLPTLIIGDGADLVAVYDKDVPSIFWVASATSFTCVNVIVNTKLILVSESPFSVMTILPTLGAWLLYFIALFMLGNTGPGNALQPAMDGVPQETFSTKNNAVQATALTISVALCVDLVQNLVCYLFYPSQLSLARKAAREQQRGESGESQ